MSHVFISYKREDLGRVEPLVTALRDGGIEVWWDQDIPPGGSWRDTIVERLDSAALCVAIWSETSVGPTGRFVREEAERSARRTAYLGLLIDAVPPPFGFSEWQAIDLSEWEGGTDDPQLLYVVETVRAKLTGAPPPAAEPRPPKRKAAKPKSRLPLIIGGGAAVAAVGAALLIFAPWSAPPAPPAPPTPTAFVSEKLAQADCTWASIGEVSTLPDGEHISLKGIAPAPEAIQASLLREANATAVPLSGVEVRELAIAPPEVCAELQLLKPYRAPLNERRLTIIPPRDSPRQSDGRLIGWFEFELNWAGMPPHGALLGLDNKSGLKVEVENLNIFRNAPARRQNGNVSTYLGGFDDEGTGVRNVGLVLMTSTQPIDKALIEAIGTDSSSAFLQRVDAAAKAGNWRFELALVRCGFEGEGRSARC